MIYLYIHVTKDYLFHVLKFYFRGLIKILLRGYLSGKNCESFVGALKFANVKYVMLYRSLEM